MCGIAGYVSRHGAVSQRVIESQLAQLNHRGPDASGSFAHGLGGVGQTRLAIIDLVSGNPPVTGEDGAVGVALNGEIYNFRELRKQLIERGHTFATDGDTEVIAHLAEDLEPVALAQRLEGMFAFAVWDTRRERLIVGRDRVGKKPLYYWAGPDQFIFASEIKALLAHPSITAELDQDVIPSYLTFGYVPTPRTFFRGIRSLPPGHVVTVDAAIRPRFEPYWEPIQGGPARLAQLGLTLDEAGSEVREQLSRAVEARLVSDVPLGAFLSGGIDSSAVVALMSQHSSSPVRTFTIGFEDTEGFDERPYARSVARRFGTEHTEFVVSPQAVDLVEHLVWCHDQPFGDSSAIPTFLLSELTRRHVTVALTGDGGDELFAGYERFAAGLGAAAVSRLPSPAARALRRLARVSPKTGRVGSLAKARRFATGAAAGLPDAFRSWISYVPEDLAARLAPGSTWGIDDYRRVWEETRGAPTLERLLLLNLRTYLLDDLLPKIDRMSMAHALEVRSPFLDHHLVEFAFHLPGRTKLRGLSLKRCLKAGMRDFLPDEVLRRGKHGFGVPLDRWFRQDLASYVRATLGSGEARVRRHLVPDVLDELLERHARGLANHGHALWTLLTLEVFLRQRGW
jgi:asparagine synthase (glutamine-hydrolysing)